MRAIADPRAPAGRLPDTRFRKERSMKLATVAGLLAATFALPHVTFALQVQERPAGAPPPVAAGLLEPTFDSIQTNVFTPSCALSSCHGEAMQALLDLRPGNSYANLVNFPSVEFPIWDRIEPYDPDHSYLICKLEACPSIVGQQMPLIGGPLDQSVINVIREWVANGAHESSGVPVEPTSWGQVKAGYR
jgi:hypothetical protein